MTFGGEGRASINYEKVYNLWNLGYGSRKNRKTCELL